MSGTRAILRAEGAALALICGAVAWQSGPPVLLVVLTLVAPDATIVAYLIGRRAGAIAYNLGHSTIGPILLAGSGLAFAHRTTVEVSLIWLIHIGIDRTLGYGLKGESFADTHLGRLDE